MTGRHDSPRVQDLASAPDTTCVASNVIASGERRAYGGLSNDTQGTP